MSNLIVRIAVAALTLSIIFGLRWFFGPLVATRADMPPARELRAQGRPLSPAFLDLYNAAVPNARTARCPDRDEPPQGTVEVVEEGGTRLLDLHPEYRMLCPPGCGTDEYARKDRPCYRLGPRSLQMLRDMALVIKRRQAGVPDEGVGAMPPESSDLSEPPGKE